jgi:hypothetical protein
MKFAVPQFIDVEDKIFGPLTFKQFVYLVGGGGLVFLCYKFLPWYLYVPLGLAFGGLGFSLAFIKVNEKPLINTIEAMFTYVLNDKLYIWKKEKKEIKKVEQESEETKKTQYIPRISESKLHDIAWGLDVLDKR